MGRKVLAMAIARDATALLLLSSFAIVHLLHLEVSTSAVVHTIEGDLTDPRAILGHGHPQDVVHVAWPVLVERGTGRAHRDVVVAEALVDVVVVQVPCKKRVASALEQLLDCQEVVGGILPRRLV